MKYDIQYFKTENLSTDELNSMRRGQRGVWLCTGIYTADRLAGFREARRIVRGEKFRAVFR